MPLSRHLCLEVEYSTNSNQPPELIFFNIGTLAHRLFFKLFHNRLQPLCSFHPVKNLCDQKQDKRNRQQISDDTDRNRTPHRDIQKCRSCRKQSPTQFQDRNHRDDKKDQLFSNLSSEICYKPVDQYITHLNYSPLIYFVRKSNNTCISSLVPTVILRYWPILSESQCLT